MDITATPELAAQAAADADIDVSRASLAFDDFYSVNVESIARALAVTLGDSELAADATNEAMIRAFQRWSNVSSYDNPAAWVYRVGLNWSLSWKRRRRRERERPVRFHAGETELASRDDSFDEVLASLSIEHRSIVVCRIYLDWSVEQTAHALEIAPGTVKSRLARALERLRTELQIEGDQ